MADMTYSDGYTKGVEFKAGETQWDNDYVLTQYHNRYQASVLNLTTEEALNLRDQLNKVLS